MQNLECMIHLRLEDVRRCKLNAPTVKLEIPLIYPSDLSVASPQEEKCGVCNVNSQEKSRRVCILTMSVFLIGGLNVRQNGRLFE